MQAHLQACTLGGRQEARSRPHRAAGHDMAPARFTYRIHLHWVRHAAFVARSRHCLGDDVSRS